VFVYNWLYTLACYVLVFVAFHSISFTASSLAISKNGRMETLNYLINKKIDFWSFVNGMLRLVLVKDLVESEFFVISISSYSYIVFIYYLDVIICLDFRRQNWSDSNGNFNVIGFHY